jgi:Bacterial capsule synthesis protein PGA_cap
MKKLLLAALLICVLFAPGISSADETVLMAVGDICPHPSWIKKEIPVSALFKGVTRTLSRADVLIGNLESPLTSCFEPTPSKAIDALKAKREFVFRSCREDVAPGLRDIGFTALTLANNHMLDYQEQGVLDTLTRLKSAGILTAGAGENLEAAEKPAVIDSGSRRFVVIAASDVVPLNYEATPVKPGIFSMKDEGELFSQVTAARKDYPDDVLVLMLHWGVEAAYAPTQRQKDIARNLIDAGADVIIGAHPHRVQGVEFYKGKPIFYSLGNFQFDSNPPGDESVIAKITYRDGNNDPVKVSVIPVIIGDGGYPRTLKANEPEYSVILGRLAEQGKDLGTKLSGVQLSPEPIAISASRITSPGSPGAPGMPR